MLTARARLAFVLLPFALACGGSEASTDTDMPPASTRAGGPALARWIADGTAYGMFVPSERDPAERDSAGNRLPPLYTEAGARALASDSLLDYLFLNLEGAYDEAAVRTLVAGRDAGTHGPTLLVRLPTIEAAGADSTRARVAQVLALGADGVVIPHVRSAEEAQLAVSFFEGANVWSPANPSGTVIAMLMVEDQGAIAALDAIANVPGYSLLSCGIGSLTRDMDGDRDGAEAACLRARELASAHGMPSMMTANAESLADRLAKGYRGILLSGTQAQAVEVIAAGRAAP
ncbi:MAG TPA: aldolase/citrate lyase family protein [Gemmatimonadaceae bacterium]|nr:aldolase/citrate lyase family protein [Gemmatimonadaceae bacterium]